MPSYQVTIAERTFTVDLRQAGDQLYARVDGGQEQPVRLDTLHGPLRTLVLGQRRFELLANQSAEGIRLAIDGLDYQAEVLDEVHARLAQVVGSGPLQHVRRELKAPMPGLVVKVLCEPGQQVEPGQSLVVLQAMKMENELSLPWGGTVTSISAESGQTVDQGQVLVVVE